MADPDVLNGVERDVAAGALSKADASPVTIADFGVQAFIAARLGRDFPSDILVAEEDASVLRAAPDLAARVVDLVAHANPALRGDRVLDWIDRRGGTPGRRFWALDPVDGTKGLLRGGQYAVALALIVDGVVQLGVLGCPRLTIGPPIPVHPGIDASPGGVAVGVRGRGAWWSARSDAHLVRLSVSDVSDPTQARVLHSFETPHSDVDMLQQVVGGLRVERPPWLMDSQAKHVVLASGGADVLLRFPTQPGFHDAIWDQAAGSVVIEEAGGRLTDLAGRKLDFSTGRRLTCNDGLVATNGVLHDDVLSVVQQARSRRSRQPG